MPYEPTNWKSGDVVTSAKLNKIEAGIASGGVLVVNATTEDDTMTLDKTWQDIYDAHASGKNVVILVGDQQTTPCAASVVIVTLDGSSYCVTDAGNITYETDSASGYPATSGG